MDTWSRRTTSPPARSGVDGQVENWGVASFYDESIGFDLMPAEGFSSYAEWARYVNDKFAGGIYWVVTSEVGN